MPRKRRGKAENMLCDPVYIYYFDRIRELAISVFKWEGLPDTIDSTYLEQCLLLEGWCAFFEDEVMGKLVLNCMLQSPLNVYNLPTEYRAYAPNGYQKALTDKDSVLIYNNMLRKNSMIDVNMFAERLYRIQKTADVNISIQKTPLVIGSSERNLRSMEAIMKQHDGYEHMIFSAENLDLNSIKVFKTDVPFLADKLKDLLETEWNECQTRFGVNNGGIQKEERMLVDEIEMVTGSTNASRYSKLKMREEACEKINKMFGLNVSVKFRDEDVQKSVKKYEEGMEGGEE